MKVVSGRVFIALTAVFAVVVSLLTGYVYVLSNQVSSLSAQVSSLQAENSALKSEIAARDDVINSLNYRVAQLQENLTYYESQVASLRNQITDKDNTIAYLNSLIDLLDSRITSLQNERDFLNTMLQAYEDSYQSLRNEVNMRWDKTNVKVFITPEDPSVRVAVYAITGGWSNTSDWNEFWRDVKAMYDWVVNNIGYRDDNLYPILPYNPSEALSFISEMWQFPNETLELREGDCEDMAILLASMIYSYANMRYYVEVIMIESSTSAHAAVQLPVEGGKLTILDPAGNYYTKDSRGNLASKDIATEINNWLNYWKTTMGSDVHVARVFSSYIDKTFTSTNEYISWMYGR